MYKTFLPSNVINKKALWKTTFQVVDDDDDDDKFHIYSWRPHRTKSEKKGEREIEKSSNKLNNRKLLGGLNSAAVKTASKPRGAVIFCGLPTLSISFSSRKSPEIIVSKIFFFSALFQLYFCLHYRNNQCPNPLPITTICSIWQIFFFHFSS